MLRSLFLDYIFFHWARQVIICFVVCFWTIYFFVQKNLHIQMMYFFTSASNCVHGMWLFVSYSFFGLHIFSGGGSVWTGVHHFMITICVFVHNMIPHYLWLPISQETFLNSLCENWLLKEILQTFVIIIIIALLQRTMSSSNSCGNKPEKEIYGKSQFFSLFLFTILTLIFPTFFRWIVIQS